MAKYIILFRWTQQGIQNVKDSPDRVSTAKHAFEAMGAQIKEFYAVMGQYDTVAIVEAPNDETIAKAALALSALGYCRTETLRAFPEDEYRTMITELPYVAGSHENTVQDYR